MGANVTQKCAKCCTYVKKCAKVFETRLSSERDRNMTADANTLLQQAREFIKSETTDPEDLTVSVLSEVRERLVATILPFTHVDADAGFGV